MISETSDPRPHDDQGPASGPDTKTEALRYADRGWSVLPLHSIRDGSCTCASGRACQSPGKHPHTQNGVTDATTDAPTVADWWDLWPDASVGIATGRASGLLVLDVDPRHGGDDTLHDLVGQNNTLPDTVEVITGSGGRHLFFAYPGSVEIGNSVSRLGPGLDVRSNGGYIVAPPSVHISGQQYEWEVEHRPDDVPLGSMPDWLQALAIGDNSQPIGGSGHTGIEPVSVLAGVAEGERNDTLFRYACRLLGHNNLGIGESAILIHSAASNCVPPLPRDEVDRLLASAYEYPQPDDHSKEENALPRRIVVRAVADWFKHPPEPVEPIVTGLLLPGDQVVIGGPRGASKTWLAMGMALQLARGQGLVLGRFPVASPVKVLYWHGELPDDYSTFARWELLTASGQIPSTLQETYSHARIRIVKEREQVREAEAGLVVTRERTFAVIDAAFVEELRHTRPDVVVLDPYAVFYTGKEIDHTQVETAMSALTALTEELGITWIIVHHFSQARQGADPEDWWRGASRLADWASVRVTLQPAYVLKQAERQGMTRTEARRYANVRLLLRRQATPPDFGARFDPKTGMWVAWESPTLIDQRRSGLTVDDIVHRLRDDGGRWESTNKAADALGTSHSKAKQLLTEAEQAGRLVSGKGSRGAATWSLREAK